MLEKILFFAVLIAGCYGVNTTVNMPKSLGQGNENHNSVKKMVNFYEDINCTKDHNGNYDCSKITQMKPDRCYRGGKDYSKGYKLDVASPCFYDCTCFEEEGMNRTKWICGIQMCLNNTNDCKNLYDKGTCCPTPRCDDKEIQNVGRKTCILGNEEYLYGEQFVLKDDPCTICYCDENFKGNLTEPACNPVDCHTDILYTDYVSKGCTPVFLRARACCPSQIWLCDGQQTGKKAEKCTFRGDEYEIGEKFEPGGKVSQCVECTCLVPPYATCVHKEKCGFSNFWNSLYNVKHNFPSWF